jgi:TetR/AcrR family transcriptional repressor of bet genes
MDGVWLEAAQSERKIQPASARRAAHQVVDLTLS